MIRSRWSFLGHGGNKVVMIAFIHLVLALYGLYVTIVDVINEQNPFSTYEVTYLSLFYFTHIMLIYFLFLGTKKMLPLLYVPWLIIFLAVFCTATCFWIESVFVGSVIDIRASITNITVLGLGWLSWLIVSKEFLLLISKKKNVT